MSVDHDAGQEVIQPLKKRSTFPTSFTELANQFVPSSMAKAAGGNANMGVDYVVVVRVSSSDTAKAIAQFDDLCHKLSAVGLATQVRHGQGNTLLVCVKVASEEHMHAEIYRSRVRDWIHGVRSGEPPRDVRASLEEDPLQDAERLRTIYQLITNYEEEGGAGIRPKSPEWKNVDSVFALHDHAFNKHWIQKWSTEYQVQAEDLDEIRDRFGEKVAYYFAFEQTYFTFLLAPSLFGIVAWLFLGPCSPIYAVFASLWSIVFVEWWKHQERDLAIRWGVRGVSNIESKRHDFHATEEVEDPATGETLKIFPWNQRLQRQLLQIPFALAAALVLGSLITLCFAIEVFLGEVYDGPGKSILTFTPTVILTTCLPLLTTVMSNLAKRLNDYENYETDSQYERSHTGKIFVLDFITSYLGIFLTAFVYLPFGSILVPYLSIFSSNLAEEDIDVKTRPTDHFVIDPTRLKQQVIYFAVTASIINFAMEVVLPYLKRQGFVKFREMTTKRPDPKQEPIALVDDRPEEKEFLERVRNEAELQTYDVYTDLREMIIQFGYLSLFSVVWPLVPVSFLINNWFELRADAVKICVEMQRPTPWRADTIGPWLDALSFLTWLGSITTAALSYMFSDEEIAPAGRPSNLKAWALLLTIFFSEHLYLFVHFIVASVIARIDSPGRRQERKDRYDTRQKLFQDSLEKLPRARTFVEEDEKPITRKSLEDDQRIASLKAATAAERFWGHQHSWRESAQIGKTLIEALDDHKQAQKAKKEL